MRVFGFYYFHVTESLMLDLVSGRQMSIKIDEIYKTREQVIEALQTFFFYSVDKVAKFDIHPLIMGACFF